MFSSGREGLEKKIKELNAVKGEYRGDIDEAEKALKRHEIDREQFERTKQRNEVHIERINEKIRDAREKLQAIR
jgi:predicted  nucleic acid-binding Zn-ribbon protein